MWAFTTCGLGDRLGHTCGTINAESKAPFGALELLVVANSEEKGLATSCWTLFQAASVFLTPDHCLYCHAFPAHLPIIAARLSSLQARAYCHIPMRRCSIIRHVSLPLSKARWLEIDRT